VESAPRAYRLKASNAAPPISTFPGAIPVTKVQLILNMKTAKALGLTIPVSLLGRADKVIE